MKTLQHIFYFLRFFNRKLLFLNFQVKKLRRVFGGFLRACRTAIQVYEKEAQKYPSGNQVFFFFIKYIYIYQSSILVITRGVCAIYLLSLLSLLFWSQFDVVQIWEYICLSQLFMIDFNSTCGLRKQSLNFSILILFVLSTTSCI